MDMHQGRFIPALAATATGTILFTAYVMWTGLDADIGNSATLLVAALAVFIVPGCAGAVAMQWRAGRHAQSTAPVIMRSVVEAGPPFPAAEAVADVLSLTEARVDRRYRDQRAASSADRLPQVAS